MTKNPDSPPQTGDPILPEQGSVPAIEDGPSRLDDRSLYLNRELSQLEFNRRVLAQAENPDTPLLERLRFLTICSTNLDEFFEVRVSGLREQIELGIADSGPDGLTPQELNARISATAQELVADQYRILRADLIPALTRYGVNVHFRDSWDEPVRKWVKKYFKREVQPILTPVGLDPAHPFPTILNKSLNFVVSLKGKDAFGRTSRNAVVQAPRLLPRMIRLPEEVAGDDDHFVTLSGVIHDNVGDLFPGMKATGCYPFRVTRNSDLWVDEEEVEDLLRALKGELPRRNFGNAVRLEVNRSCPDEIAAFLLRQFNLKEDDLFRVDGPVNLHRLAAIIDLVDRPALKYRPFVPGLPAAWSSSPDVFAMIRSGDMLQHLPFDSFAPVVEFLRQSARDPDVYAIKMTLYRTGGDSPITEALLEAARNGKEVTAVVELRARFDEEANIGTATILQDAGVKVVYGIVGYKTHAKMMLVVRREDGRLRRYAHLSTGNYHTKTARLYTDIGLFTCDEDLSEDVHNLFLQLTGLGKVGKPNKLIVAPFQLHDTLVDYIERAAEAALKGEPAEIRVKVNSLLESKVIKALYRASQAGVSIDLLVRGICSLVPGVPGVSDNIRVRSIIGRFLEHSRIYDFRIGDERVTYCSSADWMPRNLLHRVETAFPVESKSLRRQLVREGIETYLADNVQAWELCVDGSYRRVEADGAEEYCAQRELLGERGRPRTS